MPTYEQNKKHIYKWIENNKEKYNKGTRERMVKYRFKLKTWKEIRFEFFNILLII